MSRVGVVASVAWQPREAGLRLAALALSWDSALKVCWCLGMQTYNGNLTGDDFTKEPGDKSWMSEMCATDPLNFLLTVLVRNNRSLQIAASRASLTAGVCWQVRLLLCSCGGECLASPGGLQLLPAARLRCHL